MTEIKNDSVMPILRFIFARLGPCVLSGLLFYSCSTRKHDKKEIEEAMQKYDRLIQQMDEDSISMLYTKDGDLGHIAHGRDSIRKFLATFKNYRVLSQSSTTDSIAFIGDSSIQSGKYRQVVITPKGDTVTVKGEFTSHWMWFNEQSWLIKKIDTKPSK